MNYPINEQQDKWNAVKRIAHYMCEEAGIDPDRRIEVPRHKTHAIWNFLNYASDQWRNEPIKVPQWEAFIRDASIAYIGWKAVQRYMLVDV